MSTDACDVGLGARCGVLSAVRSSVVDSAGLPTMRLRAVPALLADPTVADRPMRASSGVPAALRDRSIAASMSDSWSDGRPLRFSCALVDGGVRSTDLVREPECMSDSWSNQRHARHTHTTRN